MRRLLAVLLLALPALSLGTASAAPLGFDEFRTQCRLIASLATDLSTDQALPDDRLVTAASRIGSVDHVLNASETALPVDLSWVTPNLGAIRSEPDLRKRRQMLLQLRDTLRLLEEDLSFAPPPGRATRLEMEEALKRASNVTSLPSGCLWDSGPAGGDGGSPLYGSVIIGNPIPVRSSTGSVVTFGGGSGGGFASGGSVGGGSGSNSGGGSGGSSGSGNTGQGRATGSPITSGQPSGNRTTGSPAGNTSAQTNHPPQTTTTTVTGRPPTPRPTQPRQPQPPPKPQVKQPAPPPVPPRTDGSWVKTLMKLIYAIIGGLSLLALGILLWVIWRTWRSRVTAADSSQLLGISALPEVHKHAQALFRQAEEAAAANRLDEAIRLLMTACLLLLEEQSVLSFQESLTNGEYLGRLAERRQLQDLFREPLRRFDRIIYGFQAPTRPDYETFRDVFRKLGGPV
ncbi:MAG TPA: DUF4129 domain-containing protein [Candidatus Ozemobacteraceae bacterium]|nr:DUF4129 domain-containing protein [Candidatus Ozemobacteraceae bacterium]